MPVNIRFLKGQQISRVQRVSVGPDSGNESYEVDGLLLWFADESRALLRPVSRGRSDDGKWLWSVDIDGLGEPDKDLLLIGRPYDVVDDTNPSKLGPAQGKINGPRARLSPWWPESPQGQVVYWLILGLAFVASTAIAAGGVPNLWADLNGNPLPNPGNSAPVGQAMLVGGALSAISWYLILTVGRAIYLAIVQK